MAKSVTTYEKPTAHIGLPDWYAKQWELQKSAESRREEAFNLRNAGRTIRSETQIKTEWDTRLNTVRLSDRVTELARWEKIFQKLLEQTEREICLLKDEKADAEKELEFINLPLQITSQCISMRDCRRSTELTYDDGDTELKNELCILEGAKKTLTNKIQAAWERLNRLEKVKFTLNLELQDKHEALEIDRTNTSLSKTCANISYKPNALRMTKEMVSYENWLQHCQHVKLLADNELQDMYNFRESIQDARDRTRNDIRAQQDMTDFTLRKRIYQTQKSRNELDWQKLKMQREMEKLQKEITLLDDAIFAKIDAVKCAETRLENRTCRPGFELCRDQSQDGLKHEVLQLRQTKQNLINELNSAKATYNNLETLLNRISKNLEDKQHSLMTDIMCLDNRSSLKIGDRARLTNETDRNIILTHMNKEIPLEN
ncbi:tektin-2 [Leptopilina heterotoma]|uniref:tektin-2 n=1 Tax=Leptopilina heterotoma TaxID=63436 RepID=UPI001CAA1972|nr:tektin-2 [Leptopilina heterotoma]